MTIEDSSSHRKLEIGRTLERARTERGISLRQVEEATMIRAKYLNDLERENFDVLPAVYVLGSLKTYADYLGLDGEALVLELRSRQAPQQEEQDQTDEEQVGGGFLAALGALFGFGGQGTAGDAEDEVPATEQGHGSRVYWGLGAVLILILTVAFVSSIGGSDQPAVSQVREPAISGAPSRIALSGDLQDEGAGSAAESSQKQARLTDEGVEKEEKKEGKDQEQKSGQRAQDDALTAEATGDVEITVPMPNTGSTGLSSSATAYSSVSSAATASPAAEPATDASVATTPEVDDAGASPGPTTAEPAPGATGTASASAGAPDGSGSGQAEGGGLDASELSDDIFGEVEGATSFDP